MQSIDKEKAFKGWLFINEEQNEECRLYRKLFAEGNQKTRKMLMLLKAEWCINTRDTEGKLFAECNEQTRKMLMLLKAEWCINARQNEECRLYRKLFEECNGETRKILMLLKAECCIH